MAILLAFLTRKVKVKGLDDSKYIAAIIYITSIVLAVIFISSYTLKEFVNVFAAVISAGILVASSCVLALVFIPKVMEACQLNTFVALLCCNMKCTTFDKQCT